MPHGAGEFFHLNGTHFEVGGPAWVAQGQRSGGHGGLRAPGGPLPRETMACQKGTKKPTCDRGVSMPSVVHSRVFRERRTVLLSYVLFLCVLFIVLAAQGARDFGPVG